MAVAGLALGLVGVFLFFGDTALDRALRQKYKQIEVGMTRADVVALLGPPGDQAVELPPRTWFSLGIGPANTYCVEWWTDQVEVIVSFDRPSDTVMAKDIGPCIRASLLEMTTDRAKRQWHRWFQ